MLIINVCCSGPHGVSDSDVIFMLVISTCWLDLSVWRHL